MMIHGARRLQQRTLGKRCVVEGPQVALKEHVIVDEQQTI